jgi:YVTN family beta-propeller protein
MAINLVTNKLYVADFDANRVTVIDGNQDTVKDIAVGTNPSAVAVNWVTNRIYVANSGNSTVSVINGNNDSVTNVRVGQYPTALAVDVYRNRCTWRTRRATT